MVLGFPNINQLGTVQFHHVGFATTNVDRDVEFFSMLGYRQEGTDFIDPEQGIRGIFMIGGGPRIELLENLSGSSTLTPWLEAGSRLYHLAYMVQDVRQCIQSAQSAGAILLRGSAPSVAFSGRLISFVQFRNRLVIELIESEGTG